ncbi:hypothetical protein ABT255_01705 [Streptomyces mirabilis]|uniref:hypothetical protein n=1 Tax=Streptomyces mirabilis TaxID=68239 RepID=UPI003327B526
MSEDPDNNSHYLVRTNINLVFFDTLTPTLEIASVDHDHHRVEHRSGPRRYGVEESLPRLFTQLDTKFNLPNDHDGRGDYKITTYVWLDLFHAGTDTAYLAFEDFDNEGSNDNVAVETIHGALADEIEVMNRAQAAFYDLMVKHNTDLISAGFFGRPTSVGKNNDSAEVETAHSLSAKES